MTHRTRVFYTTESRFYGSWGREWEDRVKPFSLFIAVCKSLRRQGASYTVKLDTSRCLLMVEASGLPAAAKKHRPPSYAGRPCQPQPNTASYERELRASVKNAGEIRDYLKRCLSSQHLNTTYYSSKRNRKAGRIISMALALAPCREMYQFMDAAFGFRVPRESELGKYDSGNGYKATIIRRLAGGRLRTKIDRAMDERDDPPPESVNAIARELAIAKADIEYWQEMIRLSKERKRRKTMDIEADLGDGMMEDGLEVI